MHSELSELLPKIHYHQNIHQDITTRSCESYLLLTGIHSLLNMSQAMLDTSFKLDLFTTFPNQRHKISTYCTLILYQSLSTTNKCKFTHPHIHHVFI